MANKGMIDPSLQQFVMKEQQRQRFNHLVHELTEKCWDKCVDKPSNKLDSRTSNCLGNCVERFLDTANFVNNRTMSNARSPSSGFPQDSEMTLD
ncbi:Mitochondrial import inner membrane translocase subunit Tim8 A [Mizuhopecten yessoensis]|uniref:Mitochondrial import inner membrane translocase subunit n=1 Tax=Mizuhopecten yessoensis TaxID=6573 RepID=A0A210QD12_MIZYE|nr:Mitochondrial import inner membrane translocase subunit Tim8 A [Mizuhopecten yessoensis]